MGGGTSKIKLVPPKFTNPLSSEVFPSQKARETVPLGKDVRRASFLAEPTRTIQTGLFASKSSREETGLHAEEAFHGTISNDASRRAFIKFLSKNGLGYDALLNLYFEVEEIKSGRNADASVKIAALRKRSEDYLLSAGDSSLTSVWKEMIAILDPPVDISVDALEFALEQCSKVRTFAITLLSSTLADFYKSDVYKEFEDAKGHQETVQLTKNGAGPTPSKRGSSSTMSTFVPPASTAVQPSTINTFPDKFKDVLVVDDSAVSAKLISMILKKLSHCVQIANNGRKCIEMCKTESFHVILVDLYMPIMDGFETITSLRASGQGGGGGGEGGGGGGGIGFTGPIIIGMSADLDQETEARAIECGAHYFMEKPFTIDRFSGILSQHLSQTALVE